MKFLQYFVAGVVVLSAIACVVALWVLALTAISIPDALVPNM